MTWWDWLVEQIVETIRDLVRVDDRAALAPATDGTCMFLFHIRKGEC